MNKQEKIRILKCNLIEVEKINPNAAIWINQALTTLNDESIYDFKYEIDRVKELIHKSERKDNPINPMRAKWAMLHFMGDLK